MNLRALHHRLCVLLALTGLLAFISGAGADAPAVIPAGVLLLLGLLWDPSVRVRSRLGWVWRVIALLLAARAVYHALYSPADVVLPMVDLLLVLMLAETFRPDTSAGEARLYALTFALLIAATAYRPGFVFGLSFVIYLGVLTLTLIVGQLARQAHVRGVREPRLTRAFLLQSALISVIALAVSGATFIGFPRVSRGWAARGAPVVRNVIGFADRVSLLDHGGRLVANPEVVLRAEFPDGAPPPPSELYWRGRSYDRFDGWSWARSPSAITDFVHADVWPSGRVHQVVYQAAIAEVNVLFGLSPVLRVAPRSRIAPFRENNGDITYIGSADPVYEAWSAEAQPPADSLRADTGQAAYNILPFLRVPRLSVRMQQLADSLGRGRTTDYDRALAVQEWLHTRFSYTTELPATAREASLEYFLFQRRAGHCEYFSTAMAVLLRAMGVPTRNVNGFLGGEWNEFGHFMTVTQNQAHSWVEVWFPRHGWVRFDPTPAGAAAAIAPAVHWWTPLRSMFDGVEHRWGKWVLDYDLEDQVQLAQRAADAFRRTPGESGRMPQLPWRYIIAAGVLVLVLVRVARRRATPGERAPRAAGLSRRYVRLRRAYARAGFSHENAAPLTFASALARQGAPGAAAAGQAVDLYARARFGAHPADDAAMKRLVSEALTALKQARRR